MKACWFQQWTYPWTRTEAKRGNFTRTTRNYGKTRMKSRIPSMRLGNRLLVKRAVKITGKRHKDWFFLRYKIKESTTEGDNFFDEFFVDFCFENLSFYLKWMLIIIIFLKSIFQNLSNKHIKNHSSPIPPIFLSFRFALNKSQPI